MYLELSRIQDYLLGQLRPLLRKAKKLDLDMHLLVEGYHEQLVSLMISKSGPIVESTRIRVLIYCTQDNQFILWEKSLTFGEEINANVILEDVQKKMKSQGLPLPDSGDIGFSVKPNPVKRLDEKLLLVDISELTTFYKSRFLIDGPKKLLYQAMISRGFDFQGYAHKRSELVFNGSSYFNVVSKMRSKDVSFSYHCHGHDLREMRLFPIRPVLKAFWDAKPFESREPADTVLLGSLALAKCAQACQEQMSKGNKVLWSWLDPLIEDDEMVLPHLLLVKEGKLTGMPAKVASHFTIWVHRSGALEENLSDVLMGKSDYFDKAVYIHDVSRINFNGSNMKLFSYGTVLFIEKGQKPTCTNHVIEMDTCGEMFSHQPQSTSSRTQLIKQGTKNEKAAFVPEYFIHRESSLKVHSI